MPPDDVWSDFWRQHNHEFRAVSDIEYFSPEDDPPYAILERLSHPRPNQTIIEVGSGAGVRTLALAHKYTLRPTLLDNDDEGLKLARHNATALGIETAIIKGDIFHCHIDRHFDIVWSHGVGEHFDGDQRQEYFDILGKLVKEDGILIISVSNSFNLPFMIGMWTRKLLGTWIYGFEKPFSPPELYHRVKASQLNILDKAGYECCQSFNWICFWYVGLKPLTPLYNIVRHMDFKDNAINRYFGREIVVSCRPAPRTTVKEARDAVAAK